MINAYEEQKWFARIQWLRSRNATVTSNVIDGETTYLVAWQSYGFTQFDSYILEACASTLEEALDKAMERS